MPYNSIYKNDLFANQTIIVTGGGSGIGRCTAHELAALGAHVVLLGRSVDKLEAVQAEIAEDGGSASWHSLDLREEALVVSTVEKIVAEHGQIHHLVSNAGGQYPTPLAKITGNGFDSVIRNNLHSHFYICRETYNQSMKQHGGSIVTMTADHWGGMPNMAHSGAARAGTLNLTQTMAVEWAQSGVRANAVAPGWIASSGLDTYTDPGFRKMLKNLPKLVPLSRLAEEAEVSSAITFLLSPGAAYISGQCIGIDGATPCNTRNFPLPPHDKSKPFDGFHRAVRPKILDED